MAKTTVPRTPEQRRLGIAQAVRFLVAIACIAALIALEGGQVFSSTKFKFAYLLLLSVCVAGLLYFPIARGSRRPALHAALEGVADLAAVTALVYLSGGMNSPFAVLYLGAVLAFSVFFPTPAATAFGAVSAVLYFGVGVLFHVAALNETELWMVSQTVIRDHGALSDVMGAGVLPALGFLGVAVLSSRFAASSAREKVVMEEILHGMEDGVATVDQQGKIAFINTAARKLLNLPGGAEVEGESLETLLAASAALGSLKGSRREGHSSYTIETASGAVAARTIHVTLSPVVSSDGRSRGAVAFLRDLTLKQMVEEAVKRADRLQDISEMAAGIAHEIRNPLASIRGSIQELHTSAPAAEDDRRLMKVIMKECDRLNTIIEEFLKFAGRQTMNRRPCDAARIADDVVSSLERRPDRGATKMRVVKEGDADLRADPEGLRQVLLNLCINALESMNGAGSLAVRIRPRSSVLPRADGARTIAEPVDGVSIEVSDTGSGIPPEILDRIFNPFFTTKPKGTGMGLSLVHRIVDAHSGTIRVDSVPGAGSTFAVWLPRKLPSEETA